MYAILYSLYSIHYYSNRDHTIAYYPNVFYLIGCKNPFPKDGSPVDEP